MDEDPPEILVVFLNAVIERFDVFLLQKTQNALFELAAALAGDDLHYGDPLVERFPEDTVEFSVDGPALIKDVV